jgi:LuxR family maltose regulon positive regulatory protein
VRFVNQIYAHLLIAKADYANALKVVNGLLEVFAEVGDKIRTIQFNVLQAIILNKIGQTNDALIAMEKALSLASAEGYVRSILDEGEAVGELLRMAITKGIEAEYASNLLSSLEGEINYVRLDRQTKVLMVESLSQRELEVLRLLVTNLTTPEIAEELCISISTARSHIKNIYGKLDAHSRHEAVTKARELGIL